MKILLVSHGNFAEGLKNTVENFFGTKNIYSANVSLEGGVTALRENIKKYLDEWKDEQVVICSDFKGGSANQVACEYLQYPNLFIISGINLAVILQLIMENEVNEEKVKFIIETAKEDMIFVNEFMKNINNSIDDE